MGNPVALLARAWIEIRGGDMGQRKKMVALLARAWIEILPTFVATLARVRRSPCESVD